MRTTRNAARARRAVRAGAAAAALALASSLGGCIAIEDHGGPAGASSSERAELAELRAQNEIRALIADYGRTLDARDFDAFATLWARDAEYVGGGGGGGAVVGPQAIADSLRSIFAANPSGLAGATAHFFGNEEIEVSGTRGTGTSLGAFLAQDEDGRFEIVILARYEDDYVRENGRWKFARRVVRGLAQRP